MALQIDWTDNTGTQHAQGYAKIQEIRIKYEEPSIIFVVALYHDASARSKSDETAIKARVKDFLYTLKDSDFTNRVGDSVIKADGVSLLSQLYGWVKTHNDSVEEKDGSGARIINGGNGINWTTSTDV